MLCRVFCLVSPKCLGGKSRRQVSAVSAYVARLYIATCSTYVAHLYIATCTSLLVHRYAIAPASTWMVRYLISSTPFRWHVRCGCPALLSFVLHWHPLWFGKLPNLPAPFVLLLPSPKYWSRAFWRCPSEMASILEIPVWNSVLLVCLRG